MAGRERACGCVHGVGGLGGGHPTARCGTVRLGVAGVVVPCVGGGAGPVCVGGMGWGVGYVCAEGLVGWFGALWAMQWVVEMLVMPTGGGAVSAATAADALAVADVGASGDAPGGGGVDDADGDGVVGDGTGAGGGGGSGGSCRWCNGRWCRW